MYINEPMKKYIDDLAAKKPAPGGGSAAALSAALGVALMEMVANYTVNNSKYKESEARVSDMLVKAENFRSRLEALVDEDVRAYEELSKGMKEYKDNPAKLDTIYKDAAKSPFEVAKIAAEALKLCKDLARYGNKNLITDTAIAAIFLEGAFFSAKYNVYINLKNLKDMNYIGSIHKVLAPLEEVMPKLKEEILEECENIISK